MRAIVVRIGGPVGGHVRRRVARIGAVRILALVLIVPVIMMSGQVASVFSITVVTC